MLRAVAMVGVMACGTSATTPAARGAQPSEARDPFGPYPTTGVCAHRPEDFGPFILDANQAAMRYGLTATKYADAPSTLEHPIEVCGARGEEEWLRSRQCANGHPGRRDDLRGDVGPGGQCGAIIDEFSVRCPEGKLEILIDMYQCGPNERFM